MYRSFFKRFVDLLISISLIIIFLPIMILLYLILVLALKGNPIFSQYRPGKHGQIFKLYKFRSMTNDKDKNGELLADNLRLTKTGRLLRKMSLDELPQLYNVLVGDMSLIGPRPLAVSYLPYYTEEESLRHSVLPGITGWAQVNGRNILEWDKRLALDVEYVKNVSFSFDMKIIVATIKHIVVAKDLHEDPRSVMLDFDQFRKNI